jgi:uncharacterized membrane protein YqiK
MMRTLAILLAILAIPVFAQDQGIQREMMLRQQNTDAFQLQLRQSQDRLQIAPGDLRRQQEFDARQFSERQRLENVSDRQLREVRADTPQELRPYELQKAADERRPYVLPLGKIIPKPDDPLRPLPELPKGNVDVIEAPR